MTSIHNNAGAMVALSTLTMINKDMLDVQSQIATGKKINTAADNAAIWAVTTVMEADVNGFNAISESLSLGKATVTVARNASEKVTELLQDMKELVVTAQGENVDRGKIQTDIDELKTQIESIVSAAQFNGLNLIDGSVQGDVKVISSLDRSTSGVQTNSISVTAQNLSSGSATKGTGAEITAGVEIEDSETNAATTGVSYTATFTAGTVGVGGAQYELYIEGSSVGSTVTIAEGATVDEARQQVQEYIEGLGRDDIKATLSGNDVVVSNEGKFDTIEIELKELSDGGMTTTINAAATTTPGVSSLKTESGDANATAATIQVAGTPAAGDTVEVIIGGESLGTFTSFGGTSAAEDATTFADWINTQVTGSSSLVGLVSASSAIASDTVTLSSTAAKNLELELKVVAAGAGTTQLNMATANGAATGLGAADNLLMNNANISVRGTMEAKAASLELGSATVSEGDSYTVYLREGLDGSVGEFTYVAAQGDDQNDVANGLAALISADADYDVSVNVIEDSTTPANARLQIDSTGSEDVYVALEAYKDGSGSGGLGKLAGLNVNSSTAAAQALEDMEELIQTSIDAAAAFGSSETRLDIQADFVSGLIDSMNSGIGALVDTDMEAASARLQALQVQQQLGTQALSIANSAPQNILSLFR